MLDSTRNFGVLGSESAFSSAGRAGEPLVCIEDVLRITKPVNHRDTTRLAYDLSFSFSDVTEARCSLYGKGGMPKITTLRQYSRAAHRSPKQAEQDHQ